MNERTIICTSIDCFGCELFRTRDEAGYSVKSFQPRNWEMTIFKEGHGGQLYCVQKLSSTAKLFNAIKGEQMLKDK